MVSKERGIRDARQRRASLLVVNNMPRKFSMYTLSLLVKTLQEF